MKKQSTSVHSIGRTTGPEKAMYAAAAAIGLATFLVYLRAVGNDFVNWDDGPYVLENPHIRSLNTAFFTWAFGGFYESNWHPLTWLSHALDYALWGLNPAGHHLTSIVLHALNTAVVVVLAAALLKAYVHCAEQRPSFLTERGILVAASGTALLFGLHPLHVESVAWVAERKDVLCGLFFLLSLMAYTRYGVGRRAGAQTAAPKTFFIADRYYGAALLCFVLALMSKPMAVSLPFVLLVLDWCPLDRIRSGRDVRRAVVEKLPFIALSLASSIVTIAAQKAGGALLSVEKIPLAPRLLIAGRALLAYIAKMLLPLDLLPFYPYPKIVPLSFQHVFPVILAAAITVACVLVAKKQRFLLSFWGYYVITLIPVLGLVQVGGQEMADRYTYLPSLSPFLALALGGAWVWERGVVGIPDRLVQPVRFIIAGLVISLLSFAALQQIGIWKDGFTLWNYEIEKAPGVARAYNNRGLMFEEKGRLDEAVQDFAMAIQLDPRYTAPYNNRGMVFAKTGQFDKAVTDFETAIAVAPAYFQAHMNLGVVYAKSGRLDKALEQFTTAILQDDRSSMAYYNRGLAYSRAGQVSAALADFKKSCELGNDQGCKAWMQSIGQDPRQERHE